MTITSADELRVGLIQGFKYYYNKNTILTSNPYSNWRVSASIPAQGATPSAAALCNSATTGAIPFTNPGAGEGLYLAGVDTYYTGGTSIHFELVDRLAHMGGLSGTSTSAQTVGLDLSTTGGGISAERRGRSDYSDIRWYLEWYTVTGSTAVTATINVTYDDGSTGNVTASLPVSVAASRTIQFYSAVPGRYIRGVNSVTLSATTGTTGNFGVTAVAPITSIFGERFITTDCYRLDWVELGLPKIPNDACMTLITTAGFGPAVFQLLFARG